MPHDSNTLPPRFGHFRISTNPDGSPVKLGEGGMGTTYKGHDTSLGRDVAIKVIRSDFSKDPAALLRFQREAKSCARLQHRNIATIYHQGRVGGTYFFAMEFIAGKNLQATLTERGKMPASEALALLHQAVQALSEAEKHGIVHRDIKPANIMLKREADGQTLLKLIDFGLAKAMDDCDTDATRITKSGGFMGSAISCSPEQCRGERVDTRSDIYSLGVVFWSMLEGKPPFMDTNPLRVMVQHLESPPPLERLAGQPRPVLDLLKRMLAKTPSGRPQNCMELMELIVRAQAGTEGKTGSDEARAGGTGKFRRGLVAAGAMIAISVWVGIVVRTRVGQNTPTPVVPDLRGPKVDSPEENVPAEPRMDVPVALEKEFPRETPDIHELAALAATTPSAPAAAPKPPPTPPSDSKSGANSPATFPLPPLVPDPATPPLPAEGALRVIISTPTAGGKPLSEREGRARVGEEEWLPATSWPLLLAGLKAGTHALKVEVPGFQAIPCPEILVSGGATSDVVVVLHPKPARIMVSGLPESAEILSLDGTRRSASGWIEVPPWTNVVLSVLCEGYDATTVPLSGLEPAEERNVRALMLRNPLPSDLEPIRETPPVDTRGLGEGSERARQWQADQSLQLRLPVEARARKSGIIFRFVPGNRTPGGPDSRSERPLYFGKTEVTQAQFRLITGRNPSFHHSQRETCPVESVSPQDCLKFLEALAVFEGATAGSYRLPSEAEWEHACRAGTSGGVYAELLNEAAWYGGNSLEKLGNLPHPAGVAKRANAWGFHDMLGNVWEICAPADNTAPAFPIRGGCAEGSSMQVTALSRSELSVHDSLLTVGFRIVREIRMVVNGESGEKSQ